MSLGVSGKYRLERRLGGGGMAEVFVGSAVGAEGFSRRVAIKRVLPGYSDNPGFAQMFVSEAQISSQLVHPNIVSVLDFDRDAEGRLFLVMELVDGKDLDALTGSGPLPLPVVIFVIGEMLRGLGFAHDLPTGSGLRGIVHRDVSPHNVLLSWEGAVKLSDFGIAKARAASAASASVFIKGKPAYMSPEQANGQRLDGRSDLFAVGVMLWEMTVGQRLFVAEDTRATLALVLFGQIPRPRAIRPELPKDLERVTMKLLERDLPARYATAEEAIGELMACADAPRAGREALMGILAERFPGEAPVRQSHARARAVGVAGAVPTPLPGTLTPPSQQTLTGAGGGAPPIAAPPGLGTLMAAPTGTIEASGRRRLAQVLIVAAVAIASAVASFAVVSAVHDAPSPVRRDAGSAAAGPAIPGDARRSIDAAGPDAIVDAAVPELAVDAAVGAGAAAVRPGGAASSPATAGRRTGSLYVVGMPILTVSVDGRPYGESPITITLPVGKHRVRLQNVESHIDEQLPEVAIDDNRTTTIDRTGHSAGRSVDHTPK